MRELPRCVVCGKVPRQAERSLHGELTCTDHPIVGRCLLCARGMIAPLAPPWSALAGSVRCPRCAVDAIESQGDVRGHLPPIRAELADLGFAFRERVKVELVSGTRLSQIAGAERAGTLGVTTMRLAGPRLGTDLKVEILRGLTPVHFGRTVCHEAGHAWLAQAGARAVAPEVEEGFCELVAYAWLRRRRGEALPDELRRGIRQNPDPIYGEGFRKVYAATSARGIQAVVDELGRTGRLPR